MSFSIHPQALVETKTVGAGTTVDAFAIVQSGVKVGENCSIKHGALLMNGCSLGNEVIVNAGAKIAADVRLEDGAQIGINAVLHPSLTIGRNARVEPGAIVTRSVPPYAVVAGNPAQIVGYADSKPTSNNARENRLPGSPPNSSVRGVKIVDLPSFPDLRGDLSVGEFEKDVPFIPKRYFLVYDVKSSEIRGEHAHKECEQFLICIRGSCSVVVDDGRSREEWALDRPTRGIYLPPMVWGIQYKYTSDAVLLVFASHAYDPKDYIRNYDEFVQVVSESMIQ